AVAEDLDIAASKTGMLANAAIIRALATCIDECEIGELVVDPVMVATSGARLLDADAERLMTERLLPRARLATPNLPEAAVLAGLPADSDVAALADAILASGCRAVLIKGGHGDSENIVDLLATPDGRREFRHRRIGRAPVHGTGCALSAAITAHLARGAELEEAVETAIDWLQSLLARTWRPRKGPLGMLNFSAGRG
ncbi:MAG: bifunctional hydroxymethylpyrimidine kinase/phosphomethylpyrimidine kinase, partial [Wenzhouxiangella sp.]